MSQNGGLLSVVAPAVIVGLAAIDEYKLNLETVKQINEVENNDLKFAIFDIYKNRKNREDLYLAFTLAYMMEEDIKKIPALKTRSFMQQLNKDELLKLVTTKKYNLAIADAEKQINKYLTQAKNKVHEAEQIQTEVDKIKTYIKSNTKFTSDIAAMKTAKAILEKKDELKLSLYDKSNLDYKDETYTTEKTKYDDALKGANKLLSTWKTKQTDANSKLKEFDKLITEINELIKQAEEDKISAKETEPSNTKGLSNLDTIIKQISQITDNIKTIKQAIINKTAEINKLITDKNTELNNNKIDNVENKLLEIKTKLTKLSEINTYNTKLQGEKAKYKSKHGVELKGVAEIFIQDVIDKYKTSADKLNKLNNIDNTTVESFDIMNTNLDNLVQKIKSEMEAINNKVTDVKKIVDEITKKQEEYATKTITEKKPTSDDNYDKLNKMLTELKTELNNIKTDGSTKESDGTTRSTLEQLSINTNKLVDQITQLIAVMDAYIQFQTVNNTSATVNEIKSLFNGDITNSDDITVNKLRVVNLYNTYTDDSPTVTKEDFKKWFDLSTLTLKSRYDSSAIEEANKKIKEIQSKYNKISNDDKLLDNMFNGLKKYYTALVAELKDIDIEAIILTNATTNKEHAEQIDKVLSKANELANAYVALAVSTKQIAELEKYLKADEKEDGVAKINKFITELNKLDETKITKKRGTDLIELTDKNINLIIHKEIANKKIKELTKTSKLDLNSSDTLPKDLVDQYKQILKQLMDATLDNTLKTKDAIDAEINRYTDIKELLTKLKILIEAYNVADKNKEGITKDNFEKIQYTKDDELFTNYLIEEKVKLMAGKTVSGTPFENLIKNATTVNNDIVILYSQILNAYATDVKDKMNKLQTKKNISEIQTLINTTTDLLQQINAQKTRYNQVLGYYIGDDEKPEAFDKLVKSHIKEIRDENSKLEKAKQFYEAKGDIQQISDGTLSDLQTAINELIDEYNNLEFNDTKKQMSKEQATAVRDYIDRLKKFAETFKKVDEITELSKFDDYKGISDLNKPIDDIMNAVFKPTASPISGGGKSKYKIIHSTILKGGDYDNVITKIDTELKAVNNNIIDQYVKLVKNNVENKQKTISDLSNETEVITLQTKLTNRQTKFNEMKSFYEGEFNDTDKVGDTIQTTLDKITTKLVELKKKSTFTTGNFYDSYQELPEDVLNEHETIIEQIAKGKPLNYSNNLDKIKSFNSEWVKTTPFKELEDNKYFDMFKQLYYYMATSYSNSTNLITQINKFDSTDAFKCNEEAAANEFVEYIHNKFKSNQQLSYAVQQTTKTEFEVTVDDKAVPYIKTIDAYMPIYNAKISSNITLFDTLKDFVRGVITSDSDPSESNPRSCMNCVNNNTYYMTEDPEIDKTDLNDAQYIAYTVLVQLANEKLSEGNYKAEKDIINDVYQEIIKSIKQIITDEGKEITPKIINDVVDKINKTFTFKILKKTIPEEPNLHEILRTKVDNLKFTKNEIKKIQFASNITKKETITYTFKDYILIYIQSPEQGKPSNVKINDLELDSKVNIQGSEYIVDGISHYIGDHYLSFATNYDSRRNKYYVRNNVGSQYSTTNDFEDARRKLPYFILLRKQGVKSYDNNFYAPENAKKNCYLNTATFMLSKTPFFQDLQNAVINISDHKLIKPKYTFLKNLTMPSDEQDKSLVIFLATKYYGYKDLNELKSLMKLTGGHHQIKRYKLIKMKEHEDKHKIKVGGHIVKNKYYLIK